jgi:tetratricopeptide (TPR) repeat protein
MATSPGPDCDGTARHRTGFAHQRGDGAARAPDFIEYSFALVAVTPIILFIPMKNNNKCRARAPAVGRALMLAAVLVLAGCASKPAKAPVPAPTPAPAVQSLQQYLQDAARAAGEGNNKERARELYRTAARQYPASKEPWVKLAEDYFESANYGQAILAAQEVIQREPQDSVATSVLAVSGLRVSAAALKSMRDQNSKLTGGTRSEAQALAKTLRDALGETELVPQAAAPATTDAAAPAKGAAARPAKPPVVVRRVAAPAAAAPPNAADDPFKILKK